MESVKLIKHKFETSIASIFSIDEIQFIWNQWVVKEIFNMSLIEYFSNNDVKISARQSKTINTLTLHLLNNKPIQYFFGYVYFKNLKLYVDSNVLIPRPETEQLVDLVISNLDKKQTHSVIDIGTGSGCIAIALQKNIKSSVLGVDVCSNALAQAKSNATLNNVNIDFKILDILHPESYKGLPKFDIIVSNPPYVLMSEVPAGSNVHFEPSSAIFVPDENPLVFYESICVFAKTKLNKNGKIFFEINPVLVSDLYNMLSKYSVSNIKICKDFYGKKRFIVVYF